MCLATFLYFAYGSNLLMKRIHINNPSAVRIGVGKLKDYRLDFNYKSKRWNGAAATVVPDAGSYVWGALWEIHSDHMKTLDRQEGVSVGVYKPIIVQVEKPSGEVVQCRTYQLVNLPPALSPGESRPLERQPSKIYLDTIIEGAEESRLPDDYLKELRNIKHNGYCGPVFHNCD
ncbi:gamma-glutamylcyclotransferase-like [Macrosteles quadrilineatus]|uniref:gamma-glutamylcyclotransferase-like n=1 Tax=Macrosteles quadrilineatus TaxID=74068 RepID=UPI0023E2D7F6|nr:gamma-glutamylcyclotransferase-like [Macrosteles quadrilineatus]